MKYWHMPESLLCVTRGFAGPTKVSSDQWNVIPASHTAHKYLWDYTKPIFLPGQRKIYQPDHNVRPSSSHRQVSRASHCQWNCYARSPVPGMPCHLVSQSEDRVGCRQLYLSSSQDISTTDTTPQECPRPRHTALHQKVTLRRGYEKYTVLFWYMLCTWQSSDIWNSLSDCATLKRHKIHDITICLSFGAFLQRNSSWENNAIRKKQIRCEHRFRHLLSRNDADINAAWATVGLLPKNGFYLFCTYKWKLRQRKLRQYGDEAAGSTKTKQIDQNERSWYGHHQHDADYIDFNEIFLGMLRGYISVRVGNCNEAVIPWSRARTVLCRCLSWWDHPSRGKPGLRGRAAHYE